MKKLVIFGVIGVVMVLAAIVWTLASGFWIGSGLMEGESRIVVVSEVVHFGDTYGIALLRFDLYDIETEEFDRIGYAICHVPSFQFAPLEVGVEADTFALWSGNLMRLTVDQNEVTFGSTGLSTIGYPYGEANGYLLAAPYSDGGIGPEYYLLVDGEKWVPFGTVIGTTIGLLDFDGENAIIGRRASRVWEVFLMTRHSTDVQPLFDLLPYVVFCGVDWSRREFLFFHGTDEYLLSKGKLFRLPRESKQESFRLGRGFYWWTNKDERLLYVKLRQRGSKVISIRCHARPVLVMPVDELVDEIEMTFEEKCEEEDWRDWIFDRSG